jgi:hypothetical protein
MWSGSSSSVEDQVRAGYLTALSRPPTHAEVADAVHFVRRQSESYRAAGRGDAGQAALADLCQTLICLNEFVYVE